MQRLLAVPFTSPVGGPFTRPRGRLPVALLLAAALIVAAAPIDAQTRGTPAPRRPTISELAGLVDSQAHVLEEQARALDEQKQALDDQKRTLEEQQREIERLRALLDELRQQSVAASNRLEEIARAPQASPVDQSVQDRLAKVEQAMTQIPDLPTDVVAAGEFPGSIAVPGTDAAFRLGGLVRTTAVGSLGPLGTEDRFVTSSIPVEGSVQAGKESRFVVSAVPSRFNVDVRTPTGVGAMRAFIESDFAGANSNLRLRHAFGQWKGVLVGQTWSTFADPDAEPDGIDFEGLNAIALFRQPQIRYTHPIREGFSVCAGARRSERSA